MSAKLSGTNYPTVLSLPDQKSYELAYSLALAMAVEKLGRRDEIAEQCRRSGSTYDTSGPAPVIYTQYLNRTYRITLPDVSVSLAESEDKVELRDKVLILHYLGRARGTPVEGKLISYQELGEGAGYYPSFFQRAIKPLVDCFGPTPEKLLSSAAELGGCRANYGDASVTIEAFNRVSVTLIVWKGDEEFPPNASILFDHTVLDYLSAEDINVLCQTLTWRLAKSLKSDIPDIVPSVANDQ